jgi:pyruvate/2-oxoglutarate dehydrogenase complex dihydrolipoamide dehydrogenase (E3) component
MQRVHRIMEQGTRYYEDLFAGDNGVRVVRSHGHYVGGVLTVDGVDVGLDGVPTILATGSRAVVAPFPGLHQTQYLTSSEFLHLDELPRSIAIVGGGAIAVEFAQALARLEVEVTVVLRGDLPLRGEEPEAREIVRRVLERDGARVVPNATGIRVEHHGGQPRLRWDDGHVDAERLFVATGREPDVSALDPAAGDVDLDEGGIAVDHELRTSRPRTWAVGDAIGGRRRVFQYTHAATYDGPRAAENALGDSGMQVEYGTMPRVTFTDPEVGAVGMTEAFARSRGYDVHTHVKQIRELGKARALGETEGFVKVVLDRATGKLLGATVCCAHGGDMLAELTMPLHVDQGALDAVLATTFAHPTLSEAVKVAVRNAAMELAHLPLSAEAEPPAGP